VERITVTPRLQTRPKAVSLNRGPRSLYSARAGGSLVTNYKVNEMIDSDDTRQAWEIAWSIHLQVAASYIGKSKKWLNACKIEDRVATINEVKARANSLVSTHGAPGTAALSAAAGSLASLQSRAPNGIVPIAGTLKTSERQKPI